MKMATTRLTTFSTVLLALFVRETAEERQLNCFFQFWQSEPQTQRQFQQIEQIRQILKQSSPVNKKIWRNLTIAIGREPQRNKSRLAQFIRLRKLHGSTASEGVQEISNQKSGRFRPQNLKSGQLNSSKKFSLAMKITTTSQLLFLTTAATPPVQDKSSFDLENNDLRSSRDKLSTKSGQQALPSTIGISRGKSNTSETLLLEGQDSEFVTFQDLHKNSGVVGKVSSHTVETVEVQTSPTSAMRLSPPTMEHTSLSQSSASSIGPPGFSPPNDEIIKLLNGAQNFLALAESIQIMRHLKNATD